MYYVEIDNAIVLSRASCYSTDREPRSFKSLEDAKLFVEKDFLSTGDGTSSYNILGVVCKPSHQEKINIIRWG